MNSIDSIYEQSSKSYFENIERIVHAERITKIEEMKQLVRFIDHLIQSVIHQILNGSLSDKGAKIKILQLFNIIQHCMIGNHPAIKPQIDRLLNVYEQKYKHSIYAEKLTFKSSLLVLEASKINHYVESILDKQTDPIYSESPKINPLEATPSEEINVIESLEEPESNESKQLSDYFISSLYMNLKQNIPQQIETNDELTKKRKRVALFNEIKDSLPKNVYTTR